MQLEVSHLTYPSFDSYPNQRARFFGRCTMHGGYVNCKEVGCTLRAVGKGKCAKVSQKAR